METVVPVKKWEVISGIVWNNYKDLLYAVLARTCRPYSDDELSSCKKLSIFVVCSQTVHVLSRSPTEYALISHQFDIAIWVTSKVDMQPRSWLKICFNLFPCSIKALLMSPILCSKQTLQFPATRQAQRSSSNSNFPVFPYSVQAFVQANKMLYSVEHVCFILLFCFSLVLKSNCV